MISSSQIQTAVGLEELVLCAPVGLPAGVAMNWIAGPALGVDDVGALKGGLHVVGLRERAAVAGNVVFGVRDLRRVELEALGVREVQRSAPKSELPAIIECGTLTGFLREGE